MIKDVGNQIQVIRLQRGLTQEDVSEKANIARSTLIRVEKGQYASRLDIIEKICNVLSRCKNCHKKTD